MLIISLWFCLHDHGAIPSQAGEIAPFFVQRTNEQPDDFRAWTRLGTALLERAQLSGDHRAFRQAQRAFESALAAHDVYAPARRGLARSLAGRHAFKEALVVARQLAISNVPDMEDVLLLGDLHYALGDWVEAQALFLSLGDLADALLRRGQYALESGHVENARTIFEKVLTELDDHNPRRVWCETAIALTYSEVDPNKAIELLSHITDTDHATWAQLERSKLLIELGRAQEAVVIRNGLVAIHPRPEPQLMLVRAWRSMGLDQEAQALEDSVVRNIEHDVAHGEWGHCRVLANHWIEQGEHVDRAIKWLEYEHSDIRSDAEGTALLAWAHHLNGQDMEACKLITPLLASQRGAQFMLRAGLILAGAGRIVPARHVLAQALSREIRGHKPELKQARLFMEQPLNIKVSK